jgi:hypothetical protein
VLNTGQHFVHGQWPKELISIAPSDPMLLPLVVLGEAFEVMGAMSQFLFSPFLGISFEDHVSNYMLVEGTLCMTACC